MTLIDKIKGDIYMAMNEFGGDKMRVILIALSFLIVGNAFAAASSCQTLTCVRENIDRIDASIVKLLGKRLTYVKRAGGIKKKTKSVYDPKREQKILQKVGKQAMVAGYPASIAIVVFQTILKQSVIYEKRFHRH